MDENNKDINSGKSIKSAEKKVITYENRVSSNQKKEMKPEVDIVNYEIPNDEENEENQNNANEDQDQEPVEGSKQIEEGISLKHSKTKDLTTQVKEPIEILRRRMIILEAIVICGIIGISVLEMSGGLNIYTQYQAFISTYYYETIQYYIRNLDFVFNITIQQAKECPDNFTYMEFNEVNTINGICITTNKMKKLLPNDPTVPQYNLAFEYDNTTDCERNTLILDRTIYSNYWANFYYCQVSYPQSYVSFYFVKAQNDNNSSCYDKDINCGTITGYNFCMYKITNKTNFDQVDYCPYGTIIAKDDYKEDPNYVHEKATLYFNDKIYYLIRKISEEFNGFYFSFRASYGNISASSDNEILKKKYVNYERNSLVDFSDNNRHSVLTKEADLDVFGGYFSNYFKPILMQQNINNTGTIDIANAPYNFSMRYKQNYLPDASCFDILESKDSTNRNFLNSLDLFLEHLQVSAPRYIAWTILEIVFIGIFYVYLRGFIIFNEWLGKMNLKIDELEMRNEIYTEIEINMFSIIIMILKFINNYVQLGNIKSNLDTSDLLISRDCFKNDIFFSNSIKLYKDDVKKLYDFTLFSIYLIGIHLLAVITFAIIKWIYLKKKKNYIEQELIKQKDTKKTK